MDISIIICTYNRASSLIDTLASVRELRIPDGAEIELIIVNNNSTDCTEQVIRDFIDEYPYPCKYCFEKSQGLSYARNLGLQNASGKIIAFTDDDVILDHNWLVNIKKAFETNGDLWCVGGKILPDWSKPKPDWLCDGMLTALALLDLGDEKIVLQKPTIWGANIAFSARTFSEYAQFDTNCGRTKGKLYGGEETAIVKLLLRDGKKVVYDPTISVRHTIFVDRLEKRYFRRWYFDAGELAGCTRPLRGKYLIIPLLPVKEIITNLAKILFHRHRMSSCEKFTCELVIMLNLGLVLGSAKTHVYIGYKR